ncbi:MAG: Rrf2 family transcriptional regulator [Phycisphaera sp.]|nr:Rrf2 family transcriptional regulator [Phycisphaera sp.]
MPETGYQTGVQVVFKMLTLTRKTDYALIALVHLGKLGGSPDQPESARAIAEQYYLPVPLLMNVLKDLAQARLVNATRGANGGYTLAADPHEVTLLEVITATEGPMRFARCTEGLPVVGQGCDIAESCPIKQPIRQLHKRIETFFASLTLADLMEDDPVTAQPHTPGTVQRLAALA